MIRKYFLQNEELNILNFLIVLGVVLLSNSLYFASFGTNLLLIPFFIILFSIQIYRNLNLKINKTIFFYIVFSLLLASSNINSKYSSVLVLYLILAICILVINLVKFYDFIRYFNIIIFIISSFSLFSWLIIEFNIQSNLIPFTGINQAQFRNFIFFSVMEDNILKHSFRTNGLWWEPGAFQVFVNLAFIFSLITNQMRKILYIFYALTIFLIQSTTGFLIFFLLSFIYFYQEILISKYKIFIIILIIFLLVLTNIFVVDTIIDKFSEGSATFESFLSRYYDLNVSYHMFLDNWLFGYGYGSQIENCIPYGIQLLGTLIYNSPMQPTGSDGITMFIAQNGIFSLLLLIPFLFPKYIKHMKLYEKLIISLSLFLMFDTENFTFIIIFTLLSFYGILGNNFISGNKK